MDRAEDASLGEPFWTPGALAADLELRLGLSPATGSGLEREDAYAARLQALRGRGLFFERSLAVDPHGTTATLLSLRDTLVEAGWDGRAVPGGGPRLEALAAIEGLSSDAAAAASSPSPPLPLGLADRVARLEAALATHTRAPWATLRLTEPVALWPGRWRRVFEALERLGTRVTHVPLELVPSAGDRDLQRTQRIVSQEKVTKGECPWRGDESLVWLRARTGWELGEAVAGFLRGTDSRDVLVVRMGDAAALDAALAAHGFSALGTRASSTMRAPLQVLPLALSLAFAPRDPFRALELLTLPSGPFEGRTAGLLAAALSDAPGTGSRAWQEAKAELGVAREGVDRDTPEALRARLERIEAWLEGPTHDRASGAPPAALAEVAERVAQWAQKRMHADDLEKWGALQAASAELGRLLRREPRDRLRPHELDALVARAIGGGMSFAATPEQAGRLAHVASPHAVRRQHETVVVWHAGFDPNAGTGPSGLRRRERQALAAAGLALVDEEAAMLATAAAWRQVLMAAQRTFVVATPETSLGSAQLALPLWDELVARTDAKTADLARVSLELDGVLERGGPVRKLKPLPLPEPRETWTLDATRLSAALDQVSRWSPSSLGNLLACPLRFVLEKLAYLRSAELAVVPPDHRLYGTLGHRLAEELFEQGALGSTSQTESLIDGLLERLLATEAAHLLLPGMAAEHAQVQAQLREALVGLSTLLEEGGFRVTASERDVAAKWGDSELFGRLDLLLDNADGRPVVLDLKWGERTYAKALEEGRALQLAVYAETVRREAKLRKTPHAGYFALRNGRALQLQGGPFPGARSIDGEALSTTWARVERTTGHTLTELRKGRVPATGTGEKLSLLDHWKVKDRDRPRHYDLPAESGCQYCSSGSLCGRKWEGVR